MSGAIAILRKPKASIKRKRVPYDPVYDRRATDLLPGAVVDSIEVQCPVNPQDRIKVTRSLRDDPLGSMHARELITQDQFVAGRHFQTALELTEIGAVRAIDFTREAVDGGNLSGGFRASNQYQRATWDLRAAKEELGREGYLLCHEVLGKRQSISDIAIYRNANTDRMRRYLMQRFVECLEALSFRFGYRKGKSEAKRHVPRMYAGEIVSSHV